ncbi:site-specific integrase [Leisingera methylohalidivorans]|uniref:Chorismate mutase n=1 Tax=Leisingera methylohalidivorans DSM 14336 TaxID=999552 RepID=V9VTF1_9RHOB|nr:site-specific integrase [Leisingera methylohalidivorans]AHD00610.1 chorismate mutase [Leisingera methylohalidivorans DSM 14336]
MGTITERLKTNGKPSFTAQIRKKKNGKVILNLVETFASEQAAKSWLKRREDALIKPGGLERAVNTKARKSVADCISDYIDTSLEGFGKSKSQMLSFFQRLNFGASAIEDLLARDFVKIAIELLSGLQARPVDPRKDTTAHYTFKPREPQKVNGYIVTLGMLIRFGGPTCGVTMPRAEFEEAMRTLQHQKIVTKSAQRTRRPTFDELDLLMYHFVNGYRENPRMVPMHKIVAAAIFETRRQGAILSQSWADYDLENEEITIRDMKHPRQTQGNDVTLSLQEEARAIIESMPRTDGRIFPYNSDVVSRRFTYACKLLGIEDLHFHDLRHEGISRLFEMGLTIPQVAQISGHQSWQCLKRYTQIKQRGDKYEGWNWWAVVTS